MRRSPLVSNPAAAMESMVPRRLGSQPEASQRARLCDGCPGTDPSHRPRGHARGPPTCRPVEHHQIEGDLATSSTEHNTSPTCTESKTVVRERNRLADARSTTMSTAMPWRRASAEAIRRIAASGSTATSDLCAGGRGTSRFPGRHRPSAAGRSRFASPLGDTGGRTAGRRAACRVDRYTKPTDYRVSSPRSSRNGGYSSRMKETYTATR